MNYDASRAQGSPHGRAEGVTARSGMPAAASARAVTTADAGPAVPRPPRRCLNMAAHKLDVQLPAGRQTAR